LIYAQCAARTRVKCGCATCRARDSPQRILKAVRRVLKQAAMRKSILLAFVLATGAGWLPSSASDKRHDPETVLVKVEGCLKMSVAEYIIIDDNGTRHNLIVSDTKLSHNVGHRVQIIGETTTRALDTTQAGIASSAAEVPAIRVQSSRAIGGRCDR
jgi:hypothetical protein